MRKIHMLVLDYSGCNFCIAAPNSKEEIREKKCKEICNSGLSSFKFSIDALNKEEYEKNHIGDSYDNLLENMKIMKKWKIY